MKTFANKMTVMGAAAGLLLGAGSASATIAGWSNNINPISDTVTPFPATTVLTATFATAAPNQPIRIVYNAECAIASGATNWLEPIS